MNCSLRPLFCLALFASTLAIAGGGSARAAEAEQLWVYIGTYTQGESQGIYVATLDLATGRLSEPKLAAERDNPSFLAIHPNGKNLYAVGEVSNFRGQRAGAVTAFAIDRATGGLTQLSEESSRGAGPCHVSLDPTGKLVLVANYGGGSVTALPVTDNGGVGEATSFVQHAGSSVNPRRQESPHAHSINCDPTGRWAYAADLGLDQVLIYRVNVKAGALEKNDPPHVATEPGGGPRHFAFHPSGKFAYTNLEITSQVTALAHNPETGALTPLQTLSTLPDGFEGNNSTAEIQVHPSGKWVYVSNRGHNSLAGYAVDQTTGRLTALGNTSTGGAVPRNFGIDPTGRYIIAANQQSSTLVVLKVDPDSGKLTPVGEPVKAPNPVCVKFLAK